MGAIKPTAASLKRELDALGDPERAAFLPGFFKTGAGEYGEGDRFIGVTMPQLRECVKPFRELTEPELTKLLASAIHEHRMAAVVICAEQAKKARRRSEIDELKRLCDFYLGQAARINNWDLVDVSCRDVVGEYLLAIGDWSLLATLASSEDLWERRIGMVSTWSFIRAGKLEPTFALAEQLIGDEEDLMHKATGWMLREAGKKDEAALEAFLAIHAHELPRTALRYSIERMPPERRRYWMDYSGA